LACEYSRELEDHRNSESAWEAEKRKIERMAKLDFDTRKRQLAALGAPPRPPLLPILTAPEPTIEGLVKAWVNAPAALGLFSAEGGQFIGGHGMSQDHRLKTAAALSQLWDGAGVRRMRAGDGVTDLHGRRLAVHIMVQPDAALSFLSDPMLRDQGLLSRVLVAKPISIAGTRMFKSSSPGDDLAIKHYGAVLLRLLEKTLPLAEGRRNELSPPVLFFSADAETCWREFYDRTEEQSGAAGKLASIRDFASKAAEHAARISGVLTIVENPDAREISAANMQDAIELTSWYVAEALRLAAASMVNPAIARAVRLLEWLRRQPLHDEISIRQITRYAPSDLRAKQTAENAVRVLLEHGWLVESSSRPRRFQLVAAHRD
jgi:uncharacterized protein DUF3987